jgi:hypothetical protein
MRTLRKNQYKEEKFTRFWAEISKIENDILNFPEEELSQLLETDIEPMGWPIDAGSDTSEYKLSDWTNIKGGGIRAGIAVRMLLLLLCLD